MKRLKILAGNWKMNLGPSEASDYFAKLNSQIKALNQGSADVDPRLRNESQNRKWVVCPPVYCLNDKTIQAAESCGVELGSQNIHWEEQGAFTGELSSKVLKSMGVDWTLIAHSERRQFFGETDQSAAKRLRRAIDSRMCVIYCIGETLAEREAGETEKVLSRHLESFIGVLKEKKFHPGAGAGAQLIISIAYEPVWAIGTGKTATPEQAEEAHAFIRKTLSSGLSETLSQSTSLLYGGSVTAENAASILSKPNVDGVLVGGASLKPDQFVKILMS